MARDICQALPALPCRPRPPSAAHTRLRSLPAAAVALLLASSNRPCSGTDWGATTQSSRTIARSRSHSRSRLRSRPRKRWQLLRLRPRLLRLPRRPARALRQYAPLCAAPAATAPSEGRSNAGHPLSFRPRKRKQKNGKPAGFDPPPLRFQVKATGRPTRRGSRTRLGSPVHERTIVGDVGRARQCRAGGAWGRVGDGGATETTMLPKLCACF